MILHCMPATGAVGQTAEHTVTTAATRMHAHAAAKPALLSFSSCPRCPGCPGCPPACSPPSRTWPRSAPASPAPGCSRPPAAQLKLRLNFRPVRDPRADHKGINSNRCMHVSKTNLDEVGNPKNDQLKSDCGRHARRPQARHVPQTPTKSSTALSSKLLGHVGAKKLTRGHSNEAGIASPPSKTR